MDPRLYKKMIRLGMAFDEVSVIDVAVADAEIDAAVAVVPAGVQDWPL